MYQQKPLSKVYKMVVFGSILPSIVTISGNITSVIRIIQLRRLTTVHLSTRTNDDSRRVLVIITIECALAILSSWFIDILLSLIYCKGSLLNSDDCPMYLRKNYDILITLDFLNSISNIFLHCICGKRFRRELRRMIGAWCQHLTKYLFCCYCKVRSYKSWERSQQPPLPPIGSSNELSNKQIYITIKSSPEPSKKLSKYSYHLSTTRQCLLNKTDCSPASMTSQPEHNRLKTAR
ncbi:unnamed protein product, partial [Didymodactylos carnosus]